MNVIVSANAVSDLLPGFAVIFGAPDVRLAIVLLIILRRYVSRARAVRGSLNQAHADQVGHISRRDVRPVLAAIASNLNHAIVGAGPDRLRFLARRSDSKNRAEDLRPIHI